MKASSAIAIGLLSTLSIVSCHERSNPVTDVRTSDVPAGRPAPDAGRTEWKGEAIRSALSGVERHLTVTNSLAALGGTVVEVGQKGWWKAALKSGNIAVFTGEGADREVREIDIYFQLSDGLRLRDLSPILGPYTKVFESKTAGVRFDQGPKKGVVGFADLFPSKVLPDSEVDRVSIRRVSVEDDHQK